MFVFYKYTSIWVTKRHCPIVCEARCVGGNNADRSVSNTSFCLVDDVGRFSLIASIRLPLMTLMLRLKRESLPFLIEQDNVSATTTTGKKRRGPQNILRAFCRPEKTLTNGLCSRGRGEREETSSSEALRKFNLTKIDD